MYLLLVLCSFTSILQPQVLCTPTVAPCKTFDATKDARTTCDIGRLEDNVSREKIIRMLCHRTIDERIKVKEEFEKIKNDKYCSNKNITEYIYHKESDMECYTPVYLNLIQNAFKSEYKMYLDDFERSIDGIFVEVGTMIEILLSIPPKGKAKFKEDYNKAGYKMSFDDALKQQLRDDEYHFMVELSTRERQEEKEVNQEQAEKDADAVFAERKKWKNHRRELDRVLMETPANQLCATLLKFREKYQKSLERLIDEKMEDEEFKGEMYRQLINYGYNPADYYARRLDLNFNEKESKYAKNVNRIIMIHSGRDLAEIAVAFQANTQRSLIDVIKRERQEEKEVNQEQAEKDADAVFAERKKWENHRCELDRVLMETPVNQLCATLVKFREKYQKSLERLIDEKMENEKFKRNLYRELIYYGYNPVDYYARRLDLNFNEKESKYALNVNRIILIHSGKDLVEIAAAFQANTQRSLIDVIKEKTDTDRKELLLCLAGETGFEET